MTSVGGSTKSTSTVSGLSRHLADRQKNETAFLTVWLMPGAVRSWPGKPRCFSSVNQRFHGWVYVNDVSRLLTLSQNQFVRSDPTVPSSRAIWQDIAPDSSNCMNESLYWAASSSTDSVYGVDSESMLGRGGRGTSIM